MATEGNSNKEKIEKFLALPGAVASLTEALAPEPGLDFQNRNKELRDSFIDYLFNHPQERFFQALRNWAQLEIDPDMAFISWHKEMLGPYNDTFYPEYGLQKVRKDTPTG